MLQGKDFRTIARDYIYENGYYAVALIQDHGKDGEPYRISDILKDMEQAKQMILNLYHLLNKC